VNCLLFEISYASLGSPSPQTLHPLAFEGRHNKRIWDGKAKLMI
jgi:hypothetical protein